jgi:hypothetical protein
LTPDATGIVPTALREALPEYTRMELAGRVERASRSST